VVVSVRKGFVPASLRPVAAVRAKGEEIVDVTFFSHVLFYGYFIIFSEVFSEARFVEEPPQLVGPRFTVFL
jgi:hypothetical protein